MSEYIIKIAYTVNDQTSVDANSEQEAIKIAGDIFRENGIHLADCTVEVEEL